MAERETVLVVTPDAGRRAAAEEALAGRARVVWARDLASALEAVSIGGFGIALVDAALPDGGVEDVLSALGEPGRAAVWTDAPRADLLEYGAYVQIPYGAGRAPLAAALGWMREARRSARAGAASDAAASDPATELERLHQVVAHVRHELNNPLTAILAEVQLQLMDRDRMESEQAQGLETIEQQAQRMREMVKKLRELKR